MQIAATRSAPKYIFVTATGYDAVGGDSSTTAFDRKPITSSAQLVGVWKRWLDGGDDNTSVREAVQTFLAKHLDITRCGMARTMTLGTTIHRTW